MGIYPPIGYKRDPLDKHHFIIDEDSKRLRTSFGDVEVSVPRDREGEFEPQVLKKNQTSISQDIEEKILSMYANLYIFHKRFPFVVIAINIPSYKKESKNVLLGKVLSKTIAPI